jgi:hypothetical protein
MSPKDVKRMNGAGIVVVEAKNPPAIRFLDPPPTDRNEQERAAIQLCRVLLTQGSSGSNYNRATIAEMYVKLLLEGMPLQGVSVPVVKPIEAATVKR